MAGFVVMGFSAWHLLRKHDVTIFRPSFQWAARYALIGSLLVGVIGHFQGQFLVQHQPLKMAAAEALWETEQPAGFALVAGVNEGAQENSFELKVPGVLSFLSYNNFTGEVKGLKDLQVEAVAQYGEGNYIPPVTLNFWSFRIMVGAGSLMVLLALLAVFWSDGKREIDSKKGFLKALLFAPILPYLAATFGWVMAETGRWPWIVFGLQKVENAVSPNVPAWNVAFSLIVLGLLYSVLTFVAFRLGFKYGKSDVKIRESAAAAD
jgi:cytochrome d ubiquinol oxidase subunit I